MRDVRLRPEHAPSYYNLGYSLSQKGRWEEGSAAYQQALRWQPNNIEVTWNLANNLGRLGRYREALAYFERVLQLSPENKEAQQMIDWLKQQLE